MNVVITGASRGIGFDVAMCFLSKPDFRVLALADDREGLNRLALSAPGGNCRTLAIDFSHFNQHELLDASNDFDEIDILINNAGMVINKPFLSTTHEDWQRMFEVNLFGAVKIIKTLFPKLQRAKSSHIINIGSMGGFQGSVKFPGLSAYSASKSAISNITETLAVEFQEYGVRVNCLCPGAVNTEMFQEAFSGFTAPLESHEMAQYIFDFARYGHRYFNGKILPVSLSTP